MTEKQEKILRAALELFAKEGFTATSTSKIAKHAGVSEGLIFRHFTNKEGLLYAILGEGEIRAKALFAEIVLETDPKEVIRKTLDMVRNLSSDKEDLEFWKLQYKIKWEMEQYNELKMEPLHMALEKAFAKLGFISPSQEATCLLVTIDGLATRIALQNGFDLDSVLNHLKNKYEL